MGQVQPVESIYEPINGLEAKKILKHNTNRRIDDIHGFKFGLAFHRLRIDYVMSVTAYPADCPVPEAEFSFIINAPDLEKQSNLLEHFNKIEVLENKKARLLEGIALIDKILDVARPVYELQDNLNAGDTPDELRMQEGLEVPVIRTSLGGKRSEIFVKAGGE